MDSKEKMLDSSIRVLPDHMINQIAAGEVIENPASVIKELVENSIDANSSIINVTIKAGGILLISVEDNGSGMGGVDLLLALRRHATSKIYSINDLLKVQTMGFRGEALASIAAISKLKIESAKKNESAKQIEVEAGKIKSKNIASRTQGTTVEVKSLFFNTPVRKKFQKTQRANIAAINRVMIKIALAYPRIGFTFKSDDQVVLQTNNYQNFSFKEALKNTIADVLGNEFLKEMLPISFEENAIKLSGYIGQPSLARKTRGSQYLLINKRAVFSSLISQALNEGYGTRLSEGYFPSFVLHLDIPCELIDVNVHPQKKEVRLREEVFLKDKITKAVSLALQIKTHTKEEAPIPSHPSFPMEQIIRDKERPIIKNEVLKNYDQKDFFTHDRKEESLFPFHILGMIGKFLFLDPFTLPFIQDEIEKDSIAIVDIEAAYSRCLFDMVVLSKSRKKVAERQSLHIPSLIDVSPDEKIIIEDHLSFFHHMGLELRFVSEKTIAIDTLPTFLKEEEIVDIFSSILEDILLIGKSSAVEKKMHMKFARSICRFAKGRKRSYSTEEAKVIMQKLVSSDSPETDPLGGPTYLILKEENLQKLFKNRGNL